MDGSDHEARLLDDGLDKVAEVARFFKVSVAMVYVWMQEGRLPSVKIGRSRRVPHRAV